MTPIPDHIQKVLKNPIDYSPAFTESVELLRAECSALLDVPVRHDAGMDYASGQYISFSLAGKEFLPFRKSYVFDVRFYISSKAALFATYLFDVRKALTVDDELHHPIRLSRLPECAQTLVNRGRDFLQCRSYVEVAFELFQEKAPGCQTELDGLPASIFEALFAEIV